MSQHYNKFGKSRYILLVLTSDLKSSWYQKRDDWYILPSSKGKNYFSQFIWCRYIIKKISFKLILNICFKASKYSNSKNKNRRSDFQISILKKWFKKSRFFGENYIIYILLIIWLWYIDSKNSRKHYISLCWFDHDIFLHIMI